MYYTDGNWSEPRDVRTTVERLMLLLNDAGAQGTLNSFSQSGLITAAHGRALPFYRGRYELVRLTLKAESLQTPDLAEAYLFFMATPENQPGGKARLLTGDSLIIHETNAEPFGSPRPDANGHDGSASGEGSGDDELRLIDLTSENKIIGYVRFFCAFVAGREGPFLALDSARDLADGGSDELLAQSYDVVVKRLRQTLEWPQAVIPLDEDDVEQFVEAAEDVRGRFAEAARKKREEAVRTPDFAAIDQNPLRYKAPKRDSEGKLEAHDLKGAVWYGPAVFAVDFRVMPDGMVEMLDDDLLLPVNQPAWKFDPATSVLQRAQKAERQKINSEAFVELVGDARKADKAVFIENFFVEGDVFLRNWKFRQRVVLKNILFGGDLNLDECHLEDGLIGERIQVVGRLSARRIKARRLELPGVRIAGLYDYQSGVNRDGLSRHALDLSRASIAEDLLLRGAVIQGSSFLADLVCEGPADLSGLDTNARLPLQQQAQRIFRIDPEDPDRQSRVADGGVDLSGAHFHRDLDLSMHDSDRLLVSQSVVGGLDLTRARVDGSLLMLGFETLMVSDGVVPIPTDTPDIARTWLERAKTTKPEDSRRSPAVYDPLSGMVGMLVPSTTSGRLHMAKLSVGGDLRLRSYDNRRTVIRGYVDAPNISVAGGADLSGALIGYRLSDIWPVESPGDGELILSEARLGSLSLISLSEDRHCEVLDRIRLEDAFIERELRAWGLRTGVRTETEEGVSFRGGAIDASGCEIGGDASFDLRRLNEGLPIRTQIGGDLDFSNARVTGKLSAIAVEMGGALHAPSAAFGELDLRAEWVSEKQQKSGQQAYLLEEAERLQKHLAAGGTIDDFQPRAKEADTPAQMLWRSEIAAVDLANARADQRVSFWKARIRGDFFAAGLMVGENFLLSGAKIGGRMALFIAAIDGMLDGNVQDDFVEISGRLDLSGSSVKSDTRFCGAVIKGGIRAIEANLSRVQIRAAFLDPSPDRPGEGLVLKSPEIGPILFQGGSIDSIDFCRSVINGGVRFDSVSLARDFSLFKSRPDEYLLFGLEDEAKVNAEAAIKAADLRTTSVSGTIKLNECDIGGDVELRAIDNSAGDDEDGLQVRKCKIGGDLDLSGSAFRGDIDIQNSQIGSWLLVRAPGPSDQSRHLPRAASCRSFRCEASEIGQFVAVDDLTVEEAFSFKATEVKRGLRLYPEEGDEGKGIQSSSKPTILQLGALKAETILFCATSEHWSDVRLDNAKIERARVLEGTDSNIALNGAQVSSWVFGTANEEVSGKQAMKQLVALTGFDKNVLRDAEQQLRGNGEVQAADSLHRAWRRRMGEDRRSSWPGPLRFLDTLFDGIWSLATGYWTRGHRLLLFVCLPLFILFSMPILSLPENMQPTPQYLAERTQTVRTSEDYPVGDWRLLDAFEIAADIHVPIATINTDARWELREGARLYWRVPFVQELICQQVRCESLAEVSGRSTADRAVVLPIVSPAAFGFIVKCISWVAWPLFLIGLVANIQRRNDGGRSGH